MLLKAKKQLNDICVQLIICIAYFELDRTLETYGAHGEPWFIMLSQIVAAITLILFAFTLMKSKKLYKHLNYMFFLTVIYVIYAFVTTYVNHGDIRASIGSVYPSLAMYALINLVCNSQYSTQRFLRTISDMYILLAVINLLFIIFLPNFFGAYQFFLGSKNHIGFMLILGELFVYLESEANKNRKKLTLYNIVCFISLILIFSGSGIVGMLIIAVYFMFPHVRKFIKNRSIAWFYVLYTFIWINIVFMGQNGLLNWTPVKFLVNNVLGKDLTFSGRMYIWENAVPIVMKRFWVGYGITSSPNHFYIYKLLMGEKIFTSTLSAHNQVLQSLYEIGFIGVCLIAAMVFVSEYNIGKIKNKNIAGIFRIVIIALLTMLMSEAVGWHSIITVLSLVTVIEKLENDHNIVDEKKFTYDRAIVDNYSST